MRTPEDQEPGGRKGSLSHGCQWSRSSKSAPVSTASGSRVGFTLGGRGFPFSVASSSITRDRPAAASPSLLIHAETSQRPETDRTALSFIAASRWPLFAPEGRRGARQWPRHGSWAMRLQPAHCRFARKSPLLDGTDGAGPAADEGGR